MKELETTTYKGKKYTIDNTLEEIRLMEHGRAPEFIPFDSEKGQLILVRSNKIKENKSRASLFSMDLVI